MQFHAFDDSYLERLRSGDVPTENHFVTYFRELIQLKLRSRLNSKESIEDVQQETFVRVLSGLRSDSGLRRADRLGAYVNSVCNHVLLEHYRAQRRTEPLGDDEPKAAFTQPQQDAFSIVSAKETQKAVAEILEHLSERDRSLLREVLLEERDKDEVCRDLGVDREYLRVLLHRAKQSFKSCFISRWPPTNGSVGIG